MKSLTITRVTRAATVVLALLTFGVAIAQQQPADQKERTTAEAQTEAEKSDGRVVARVIEVKHLNWRELEDLAELLRSWAQVHFSRELNVLTVRGDPESVAQAEEVVKKFDVPRARSSQSLEKQSLKKDLEIIAHVLGATDEGQSQLGSHENIERVVAELRKKFPYKGYRLLETVAVRTGVGNKASVAGHISDALPPDMPPISYNFEVRASPPIESREDQSIIQLSILRFSARVPVLTRPLGSANPQFHYQDVEINTAMDVREGDTVVVGKAGVHGPVRSFFLVLTASLVE